MTSQCSIFISYRRTDVPGYVRALMCELRSAFGRRQVFLDLATIKAGNDFVEVIEQAVDKCELLLAVIGPTWLTVTDEHGQPRINKPNDFIKLEIDSALKRKIPVIPVLVKEAEMPKEEELPFELKALASLQAVVMTHDNWDDDVKELILAIDSLVVAPKLSRQYDGAKLKLQQGYWEEALGEFNAIESVHPGYDDIVEITRPIRQLSQRLSDTGPQTHRWQRFALQYPIPLILAVSLAPHVLSAAFNYIFNWNAIVRPLQLRGVEQAQSVFSLFAIWVNAVSFTIGIAILIFLASPITKGLKALSHGLPISSDKLSDLRRRCIRLGHLIAVIGSGMWIIAGPVYPILIGALEVRDYVFFIISLAISGVAVAAYPFMMITALCTHVFYRPLIRPGSVSNIDITLLDQVDSWKWTYLLLAGSLPMLVISLGFFLGPQLSSPQSVNILLGVVGLGGFAGFFMVLMLFKTIQNDLELLRQLLWACGSK